MRNLKALTAAMRRERGKMTSVPPQRMKQRQTASISPAAEWPGDCACWRQETQVSLASMLTGCLRKLCMLAAGSAVRDLVVGFLK